MPKHISAFLLKTSAEPSTSSAVGLLLPTNKPTASVQCGSHLPDDLMCCGDRLCDIASCSIFHWNHFSEYFFVEKLKAEFGENRMCRIKTRILELLCDPRTARKVAGVCYFQCEKLRAGGVPFFSTEKMKGDTLAKKAWQIDYS